MQKLDQKRALIYILLVGILPLLFVVFWYFEELNKYTQLELHLNQISWDIENKKAKEQINKQIKAIYKNADRFYIDTEIESFTPLQKDLVLLQELASSGFHPQKAAIAARIEAITGKKNKITLVETATQNTPQFKETEESLLNPVEMDITDIMTLLNKIERIPKDREEKKPHLIVTSFSMERKKQPLGETYLVSMKLLKREYKD